MRHTTRATLVASVAALALLAPTATPRPPQRRPRLPQAGRAVQVPDRGRPRRRRVVGRPLRHPDRAAGPAPRRQRHRRGRRHRGGARRDRALQRRHRRRRLLRPLRRRQSGRSRPSTAGRPRRWAMPRRRVRRPRDRASPTASPRPGHQRRLGRRARHPRHLAAGARPVGHPHRWRSPCGPAARLAREGFVVDQTFHQQTADNQERFAAIRPDPAAVPARRRAAGRSGRRSATPTSPTPTELLADAGPARRSTAGGSPDEIVDDRAADPPTTAQHRPAGAARASWSAATSPATDVVDRAPTHSGYRGYDVYGMAPSSSGGIDGRRGAQHPGAVRPRGHVRPGRAAPLPRGQRARVRRPGRSTSATPAFVDVPQRRPALVTGSPRSGPA